MSKKVVDEAGHTDAALLGLLQFGAEGSETLLSFLARICEATQRSQHLQFLGLYEGQDSVHSARTHQRLVKPAAVVRSQANYGPFGRRAVAVQEVQEAAARNADSVLVATAFAVGRKREPQGVEILHQQNAVCAHRGDELVADRIAHAGQAQRVKLSVVLEGQRADEAALASSGHAHKEKAELVHPTCPSVAFAARQEAIHVLQETRRLLFGQKQVFEGLRRQNPGLAPLPETAGCVGPDLSGGGRHAVSQSHRKEVLERGYIGASHPETREVGRRVSTRSPFFPKLHREGTPVVHPHMKPQTDSPHEGIRLVARRYEAKDVLSRCEAWLAGHVMRQVSHEDRALVRLQLDAARERHG